jgi:hypothetical protein
MTQALRRHVTIALRAEADRPGRERTGGKVEFSLFNGEVTHRDGKVKFQNFESTEI